MQYRKARFSDVEQIHKLVNDYAAEGLMLARSRNVLYESLREFILAEDEGHIVGVGALHLIWDALAEVRTMAVAPEYKEKGVGRKIVETLIEEGRELGVTEIFALTYQPGFFAKLGFYEVQKEELPHKVWKECINCPKFPNCDETAVTIKI
ncbi:N-acetyltransferase [Azotosporobacter soli]|uniref:N-acetyltransferase n=1 Tax=Azotosporobacter soli TaxID=3055040 RepID=UPI0031FF2F53